MKKLNYKDSALIIFTKNPVKGKVKTRLAEDIGSEKTLEIFLKLLNHTYYETKKLSCKKFLFLSDHKDESLYDKSYIQRVQSGKDFGEKMKNAFENVFKEGFKKAVLIGTDSPEISGEIIENAFYELSRHDFTIGPAFDGGYYLLGMKMMNDELFEDMLWSTGEVFKKTTLKIKKLNKKIYILKKLHDVDNVNDLKYLDLMKT